MKDIKVSDILKITKGKLIIGNEDLICENFSKDTRTINKGDIYIGIKGEQFDGSEFWKQALDNGAEAVIIQNIEITLEEIETILSSKAAKRIIEESIDRYNKKFKY